MRFLPDALTFRRALRDPLTWGGLLIDLVPVYAVLLLEWRAAPLIILYWLENGVIGVFAGLRMLSIGVVSGAGPFLGSVFMTVFFAFHYGIFWTVHGAFVMMLAGAQAGAVKDVFGDGVDAATMASLGTDYFPGMSFIILLIVLWNAIVLIVDFWLRGEVRRAKLDEEMFGPYARVVVLHIGIFAGFFALTAIGQPAWGVLGLILLHAAFNFVHRVRQRGRERLPETGTGTGTGTTGQQPA